MTDPSRLSAPGSLERWFETHYFPLLCALLILAVATRAALIVASPRPFGYVWDLYHEGVIWTWVHGRLPLPKDCWECYNPPLYFISGAPHYALGAAVSKSAAGGLRALTLLSTACAGIVVYYCYRLLRLLGQSGAALLLGTALALVFPCLFISSYGAENDVLLAALMAAFFYRLCRYYLHPARASWREPTVMGILAGLAALTKYPGLLTAISAAIVMSPRLIFGRRRLRTARDLLIGGVVAASVCGWHYAANVKTWGKPFLAPLGYADASSLGAGNSAANGARYDFRSFKIKEVVDLYRPGNDGALTDFPVYASVFSTLHALAWTDMSFFSVPSRHGWRIPVHYDDGGAKITLVAQTPANVPRVAPYPAKKVDLGLVEWVLRLGVFPTALALIGLVATLRRRIFRPFLVFAGASLAAYVRWFLAQPAWALKTKYILFLLPVYVVYAVMGVRAAYRLDRRLGHAAAVGLIAALIAGEAYLWMFALA